MQKNNHNNCGKKWKRFYSHKVSEETRSKNEMIKIQPNLSPSNRGSRGYYEWKIELLCVSESLWQKQK
jgi:hypothetical protein